MARQTTRYQEVATIIRNWISSGTIKPGERLRSIREMSRQTGYSIVTVHHAYSLLESEGAIVARPRSGFFVAESSGGLGEFPEQRADPPEEAGASDNIELARRLSDWLAAQHVSVRRVLRAHAPMPTRGLATGMMRAYRNAARHGDRSSETGGMLRLREAVAARNILRGTRTLPDQVVIVPNAMAAFATCMDTLVSPGGKVVIETPGYFPALSVLHRRGIGIVELYSHPRNGVDPDQLDHLLRAGGIDACILMPSSHYPTGVSYSDEVRARLVSVAASHGVAIVENDVFAELQHSAAAAPTLRRFDAHDNVVQFGSFGPTLGANFGLGWIVTGRHRQDMLVSRLFYEERAGSLPIQDAVADYVSGPAFDRTLRRYREGLGHAVRRGMSELGQVLPRGSAVSRPDGGHTCWIRCPVGTDTLAVAQAVGVDGPLLVPGPVFSPTAGFRNFFSLDLSAAGTPDFDRLLERLGPALAAARA
ncbi:MAG: aminotransferase-like domain-containing protein [Pseudooceanicola sp.]